MEGEPVTIVDRNVLKVLSADTRMDILKALSEGGRTPSDLSKRLKKTDATIVEHLEILGKVGLVKKIEEPGKKWIFYTLTERGEGIIASKNRKLVIILGTSIVSGIAGLTALGAYTFTQGAYLAQKTVGMPESAIDAPLRMPMVAQTPWLLYISITLVMLSVAGIGFYLIQKSRGGLK